MRFRTIVLTLGLVAGFVLATSYWRWPANHLLRPLKATGRAWSEPSRARTAGLSADEQNNIEIYRYAREATVNITSTVYRRTWFFEIYPSKEMGSGFLINEDGRILTNAHVLQGQGKIEVTMHNHDRYTARILARDTRNDLALIQVTPRRKIPVLRLGDSENLQVGQKVLAIGNPFGLEGTLTTGIISSIGRDIQDEKNQRLEGMIQTDAAINPGNSGGPLLDSSGNVIGINTAIYGPGSNIGIGFALPINRAKTMLEDYRAGRSFGRPWLGVNTVYVAGDLADALNLPPEGGLLVQEMPRGSPAAVAGLRGPRQAVIVGNTELGVGGDLIMAIDGRAVDRPDAITRALTGKRPGDTVELTLFRNGRKINVKLKLGEYPDEE
jgi:S1-C subfamily serine protease